MKRHQERAWDLALIDIDGTLCRGTQVIEGAPAFVQRLRKRNIRPVFFTNNATRTPEQVRDMLMGLGFEAHLDEVCTAAQAAAAFIREELERRAVVAYVGVEGLRVALEDEGLHPVSVHHPEFQSMGPQSVAAVVGLDQTVTYGELAAFCQQVMRIGSFVLTNPDVRLPVAGSFMPGNGAIGSFVGTATGIQPVVTGKPESRFVDYAIARYHGSKETTLIVGDNVRTDVAAGVDSGVYSILVATGVSYDEDTAGGAVHWVPDERADSVADLFLS